MELRELVADVEDVNDLECMEKLIGYFEDIQKTDEEFMEFGVKLGTANIGRLRSGVHGAYNPILDSKAGQSIVPLDTRLAVKCQPYLCGFSRLLLVRVKGETVTWLQPWYQQFSTLTRTADRVNGLETYRTDYFTKEEGELVAKNWKKFTEVYNVPDKPECFARWKNRKGYTRSPLGEMEKARQFVAAFLARGLERSLYQVFKYFVQTYAFPVKMIAYSEIEEKIMDIVFNHKPNNAVPFLSVILGREPRGICKRLHLKFNGKPVTKKIKYTLEIVTKLVHSLMKHSELPFKKLKNVNFDKSVWFKVQEDIDYHFVYLKSFWYRTLHAQLFVKYDVKLQQLRNNALKRLTCYAVWRDIRWREVVKTYPDGFTPLFFYNIMYSLLKTYPGNMRKEPLGDVIAYGHQKLKKFKGKRAERRLKTLKLIDGNLQVVKRSRDLPY